jgi:hypothetical protein
MKWRVAGGMGLLPKSPAHNSHSTAHRLYHSDLLEIGACNNTQSSRCLPSDNTILTEAVIPLESTHCGLCPFSKNAVCSNCEFRLY